MKRILTTNISPSGSLNTDAVGNAFLLHRNTPPADMGVSPSELLFRRSINDYMPKPVTFRQEWSKLADMREKAHAKRFQNAQRYAATTEQKQLEVETLLAYKTSVEIAQPSGIPLEPLSIAFPTGSTKYSLMEAVNVPEKQTLPTENCHTRCN